MKTIHKLTYFCVSLITMATAYSCSSKDDYRSVEAPPKVNFTATPIAGMNNRWLIQDLTPGAFIHQWDLGDGGGGFNGMKNDTAYYPEAGRYMLKLKSYNKDGFSNLDSLEIVVATDDPDGCSGKFASLTGCDFKVWVLDNASPGALWVGNPVNNETWWSSGASVPAERPCLFNDEYIFYANRSYHYDNKGDLWVDDEAGGAWPADIGLPVGCASFSNVPAKYQAWGSSTTHRFSLSSTNLTLTGLGAFVGLYKAGGTPAATAPENSNNYFVEKLDDDKMILVKRYDGIMWKFTFIPKD